MSKVNELRIEKAVWRTGEDSFAEGWGIEEYDSDSRFVRMVSLGDHPFAESLDVAITGVLGIALDDYANDVTVVLPASAEPYRLTLPSVT